jgi:hypothetical protein
MDVKTCRPLTPQQLSDIIQAIDYTSSEKAFNEMVSKTLYADKIFIPSVELYYSVPKYLLKSSIHPGNVKDNKTTIEKESYCFDGHQYFHIDPLNNQTHVHNSGCNYDLSFLRFISVYPTTVIKEKFSFSIKEKTFVSFCDNNEGTVENIYDIETGMLLDRTSFLKNKNKIGRARYQRCFSTTNSIVFPYLTIQVEFENDEAICVEIILIEKASFNVTIPDSIFSIELPEEMRVLDFRYNKNVPSYTKLTENTPNVLSVIGDNDNNFYQSKRSSIFRWIFLIVGNIVLISLVIYSLRRHRSKSQT